MDVSSAFGALPTGRAVGVKIEEIEAVPYPSTNSIVKKPNCIVGSEIFNGGTGTGAGTGAGTSNGTGSSTTSSAVIIGMIVVV